MLDRFADAGGTFIDTAESHQAGESEEILGELLSTRPDRFTLTTKFAVGVVPGAGVEDGIPSGHGWPSANDAAAGG